MKYVSQVGYNRLNDVFSWMLHLGCCCSHLAALGDSFLKALSFNTSKINDYILNGGMTEISHGHTVIVGKCIEV